MPFQSLLSRIRGKDETLHANDFRKAPTPAALFTPTDPATDGEDCSHDCASCTIRYPSKFPVDQDEVLFGRVNGWSAHVVVATGKNDWVRDVADEKGSIMQALSKASPPPKHPLKVSASDMPVPSSMDASATTILLLPAFVLLDNVTPSSTQTLVSIIDSAPQTTSPLHTHGLSIPRSLHGISIRACPHEAVILLCSQRTRDVRCGQSAPLLRREFERHLRPRGLARDLHDERPGGVGIYFISHVGGHKFAANVIVYRRAGAFGERKVEGEKTVENGEADATAGEGEEKEDPRNGEAAGTDEKIDDAGAGQCIWLARVRPEDCENIVRYTVMQGKVVKPDTQLRGGFDREKGLVSW
ncbi:hypothetical protein EJ06DRAFT_582032 [Trichodelitschia bisporula]|uniref:Sucrase/ferredoxin-like family protein n=1 Tax=Trichodelitschia bisporula TaxID=703511 RepID=A0A6G1HYF6_9PEZI|nr:hypothetical protein EJ06DRAFT_582032 [Trichodelitschia bisporula]